MKTLLIDYGAGNLHSVHKALLRSDLEVEVSDRPALATDADALVLPGQGHFGQVMTSFLDSGFEPVVREHIARGRAFLGICVGLQLLLERSEEAPEVPGLGLLPGTVRRFPPGMRVPQMGWNRLHRLGSSPLLDGIEEGAHVYFANSYYADFEGADFDAADFAGTDFPGADFTGSHLAGEASTGAGVAGGGLSGAYTSYGDTRFLSAVSFGRLHATQFHPEKSQRVGLDILSNFGKLVRQAATGAS